ncbi:MAG: hypothetical protein R6V47_04475 [Candidatus Delongbacteria bacterium]
MLNYNGDQEILKLKKTGFLCSRHIPKNCEKRTWEWVNVHNNNACCIVTGYHSRIEKKVFRTLLKGDAKIILVLSSSVRGSLRKDVKKAVEENRLLIISPVDTKISKPAPLTAEIRNKLIVFISDDLFIAHTRKGGLLERIISGIEKQIRQYRTGSENRLFLHSLN